MCFRKEVAAIRTYEQLVHRIAPEWTTGTILEYRNTRSISSQILPPVVTSSILSRDGPNEIAGVGGARVLRGSRE